MSQSLICLFVCVLLVVNNLIIIIAYVYAFVSLFYHNHNILFFSPHFGPFNGSLPFLS